MRLDVEKLGTALVVLVTVVTLASLGVYGSFVVAAADLHAQVDALRGREVSRSALGQGLAAVLARDLAPTDVTSLDERALLLDHRADRLLELTAVVALVGMLVALVSGRPAVEPNQARDDHTPLASTSSNGTV
jgi:hypothetical protein